MGLLRKKREGVIDFTLLQKRGILNVPKIEPKILDLGPVSSLPSAYVNPGLVTNKVVGGEGEAKGFLGFLDSPSAATSNSAGDLEKRGSVESDVQTLRVKIDDLEYKLDRLLEKLQVIEGKIN